MSAMLSNCAPKGVPPPNARAAKPSSTSKNAPAKTSQQALVSSPWVASITDNTPQHRFAVVSRSRSTGEDGHFGAAKLPA